MADGRWLCLIAAKFYIQALSNASLERGTSPPWAMNWANVYRACRSDCPRLPVTLCDGGREPRIRRVDVLDDNSKMGELDAWAV